MQNRILGFDLARAYAIFGMFIVNFNIVFGSYKDESLIGQFLNLFNGNSSSIFVVLAGMGVALMTNRAEYTPEEKRRLKSIVIRRSWFLFAAGLLLYNWWSADILHFYGGYLHIAALLLFVPKRFYLWSAAAAVVIFHLLLVIIPYENGWNFETLQYTDFWTLTGFLRNTFYNGWNPIFPWIAYFLLGMWLGRLDWQKGRVKRSIFIAGASIWAATETLQIFAGHGFFAEDLTFYLTADYIPPFLSFMFGTAGFALMILVVCLIVGERCAESRLIRTLAQTGQMTLTHYVVHLTLGMIIFAVLTGKTDIGVANLGTPTAPLFVLIFAVVFFAASVVFSRIWSRKFKHGPLETVMRKITG